MSKQISGQITVTTAGTAVQGPDFRCGLVWLKALPDNTGIIYVGQDGNGDVSSTTGFPVSAGELIMIRVTNLNLLWFDSSVNGEKIAYLIVED